MTALRPRVLARDALLGFAFGLAVALGIIGWVTSVSPAQTIAQPEAR